MQNMDAEAHATTSSIASRPGRGESELSAGERRWRRERRSAWLRLVVLAIMLINLWIDESNHRNFVHDGALLAYASVTVLALSLALAKRAPGWSNAAFVAADAVVVVALFHEHLFGSSRSLNHNLTTSSLAVGFLLLNHVALRLRPGLVLLFATLVVTGWLSFIAAMAIWRRSGDHAGGSPWTPALAEVALAGAFAFAAFVAFRLTQDHDSLMRQAIRSERRRVGLSRFFSPDMVAELQSDSSTLELRKREAAVLFVDLRSFTRFAEEADAAVLAELLTDYRRTVTRVVFECGGTVDKFIGDGVMAVFGQPRPKPDDLDRALRCALRLSETLAAWTERRRRAGKPAPRAGIGLHVGQVFGGVIESGGHDEFTVFGDAVNVAERLERLTKTFDASLVVSAAVLDRAPETARIATPWIWKDNVSLDGRSGTVRVAYLPRTKPVASHK